MHFTPFIFGSVLLFGLSVESVILRGDVKVGHPLKDSVQYEQHFLDNRENLDKWTWWFKSKICLIFFPHVYGHFQRVRAADNVEQQCKYFPRERQRIVLKHIRNTSNERLYAEVLQCACNLKAYGRQNDRKLSKVPYHERRIDFWLVKVNGVHDYFQVESTGKELTLVNFWNLTVRGDNLKMHEVDVINEARINEIKPIFT